MVLQNLAGSLSETFFHKISIYIQWMLIYLKYHGMKQYISTGSLVPCTYDVYHASLPMRTLRMGMDIIYAELEGGVCRPRIAIKASR